MSTRPSTPAYITSVSTEVLPCCHTHLHDQAGHCKQKGHSCLSPAFNGQRERTKPVVGHCAGSMHLQNSKCSLCTLQATKAPSEVVHPDSCQSANVCRVCRFAWDASRTARFALVGATLHGPLFLKGFQWIDRVCGSRKTLATVRLNQLSLSRECAAFECTAFNLRCADACNPKAMSQAVRVKS